MKILISRCLLGCPCRYDGKDNLIDGIKEKLKDHELVDICPEVDGGMTVPRDPSEISAGRVINIKGKDVTSFFEKGAQIALKKANDEDIKLALLKAKSPSCGHGKIYDGTFSKKLIKGNGICADLLEKNGLKIFSEEEFNDFIKFL
jgi:uncharacterized protein YbbK (DUF523 family)